MPSGGRTRRVAWEANHGTEKGGQKAEWKKHVVRLSLVLWKSANKHLIGVESGVWITIPVFWLEPKNQSYQDCSDGYVSYLLLPTPRCDSFVEIW